MALAGRGLRRNRIAIGQVLFLLIVLVCFAAPLYAKYVAQTDPFPSNIYGSTTVDGKTVAVMDHPAASTSCLGPPIGPTWDGATTSSARTPSAATSPPASFTGAGALAIGIASALIVPGRHGPRGDRGILGGGRTR